MERAKITIETTVSKSVEAVWEIWTNPRHIKEWNSASDDWYTPEASNDLRTGGRFSSTMAAKDGSAQFDFWGTYTEVMPFHRIAYTLGDDRKVEIDFRETEEGVKVIERFEAEEINSLEMQQAGWQSILDHFKRYAEVQDPIDS